MDFLLPWLVLCLVVMPGTVEPSYDPEESQNEDKASAQNSTPAGMGKPLWSAPVSGLHQMVRFCIV